MKENKPIASFFGIFIVSIFYLFFLGLIIDNDVKVLFTVIGVVLLTTFLNYTDRSKPLNKGFKNMRNLVNVIFVILTFLPVLNLPSPENVGRFLFYNMIYFGCGFFINLFQKKKSSLK